MCTACGIPTHIPAPGERAEVATAPGAAAPIAAAAKFAALRNPSCRIYLVGGMLSMMADNVEHVITYWVLWQRFHSTALTGFEVISHWLPFFLLSPYFGALADRHDCRRLIQGAQLLFMTVSVCWGVLFVTGSLRVWSACVLLVLHGTAGSLWGPAEQLMLEDFVGPAELPSAIRLNATARSLGILLGPVVGSALLFGLGPVHGIFANVLIYLPMTALMARTKYTGHLREGFVPRARITVLGAVRVFRKISRDQVLVAMIILAGLGSFFIGAAIQTAMPAIAGTGAAYGVLLFANGLGGVLGGLLLEGTGWLKPSVRTAILSTGVYGLSTIAFAFTRDDVSAAALLVVGGVAALANMSITQTVVQLRAPRGERGQVIGLYGTSANGLRMGSGLTVGFLGAIAGLRWSLGLSAAGLVAGTALVALWVTLSARRRASAPHDDIEVTTNLIS